MKFRKGARLAKDDKFRIGQTELKFVEQFEYLGVTLSTNIRKHTRHIKRRCSKAITESYTVKNPAELSIRTALKIFHLKLRPMATYALPLIWDELSLKDLEKLGSVKAAFVTRCLGVHRTTKNRLAYQMAGESYFVEELQRSGGFSRTTAFESFMVKQEEKLAEIDPAFYDTLAMKEDSWKEAQRPNRHTVTRFAFHGFHNVLYEAGRYHEIYLSCRCTWCEEHCSPHKYRWRFPRA